MKYVRVQIKDNPIFIFTDSMTQEQANLFVANNDGVFPKGTKCEVLTFEELTQEEKLKEMTRQRDEAIKNAKGWQELCNKIRNHRPEYVLKKELSGYRLVRKA